MSLRPALRGWKLDDIDEAIKMVNGLRPALRGWKLSDTVQGFLDGEVSPTRLEGMETKRRILYGAHLAGLRPALSGWKLATTSESVGISTSLRPALRGWKRPAKLTDHDPNRVSDPP